jgi:hypothetical protein
MKVRPGSTSELGEAQSWLDRLRGDAGEAGPGRGTPRPGGAAAVGLTAVAGGPPTPRSAGAGVQSNTRSGRL